MNIEQIKHFINSILIKPLDIYYSERTSPLNKVISGIAIAVLTVFTLGGYAVKAHNYFEKRKVSNLQKDLFDALKNNDTKKVDEMLTKMPSLIKFINGLTGHTPSVLHVAVSESQQEMVEILLKHKADPDVQGRGGYSSTQVAIKWAKPQMLQFLLDKGASIAPLGGFDGETPSPLITDAVELDCHPNSQVKVKAEEKHKIIKILIEYNADLNPVTGDISLLAKLAKCSNCTVELLDLMMENGAKLRDGDITKLQGNPFLTHIKFRS